MFLERPLVWPPWLTVFFSFVGFVLFSSDFLRDLAPAFVKTLFLIFSCRLYKGGGPVLVAEPHTTGCVDRGRELESPRL